MNCLKVFILLLCVCAVFLVPTQLAHAFLLKVSLRDAKSDSGKVTVYVYSHETGSKKSTNLNVGKIVTKTGDSSIENIHFTFNENSYPPMVHFQHVSTLRHLARQNANKLIDITMHGRQ